MKHKSTVLLDYLVKHLDIVSSYKISCSYTYKNIHPVIHMKYVLVRVKISFKLDEAFQGKK